MTPRERLITVKEGASLEDAKRLMSKHRLERVLVVNDGFELRGLVTVKDILKATEHPNAAKDSEGKLRVGAAVGVGPENDERVELLVKAGVDVIVVDTAHGHSQGVLDRVKWVKQNYPQVQVIGGNIATGDAAKALADHGADGVKVGIGPGSICTTRIVAGVGVPQITAVVNVANALKGTGIPLIADGGVRYADRYFQEDISAANAEKLVPEGIEGQVPYKGSVLSILHQLSGGIRSSMGYCGCTTITQLHEKAGFVEITSAGVRESHVHDVKITKEAPNYHVD
jgi:IMP dehydrogenase